MKFYKNIGIFCGARDEISEKYKKIVRQFAVELGKNKLNVVYGGTDLGLMGVVAHTAKLNGSKIIGVFPQDLKSIEDASSKLDELFEVQTLAARKEVIMNLSDIFVTLPGGIGTLDEFFEVLTLKYLKIGGIEKKPLIVLNFDGYWDNIATMLNIIMQEKFARASLKDLYEVVDNVEQLMDRLMQEQ